ncbi:MAG: metallophosphoesterase [Clostridiales Family XIII bacterium]|jgi:predicted phosphohydrolase|nr:metallophosphoesterase [Clostridiales Family XIII bacterium]
MGKLFAVGDLHLSFTSEKPMGVFGSNWDEHYVKIEKNWRAEVSNDDTVFILGDISWALKFAEAEADLLWIHGLPGRKVLLKGNHDLWWQSVTRLRALYDDMYFMQNDSVDVGGGVVLCGSRGWLTPQEPSFSESVDRKIYERELIRLRLSLEDATRRAAEMEGAARLVCGLHFAPSARPGMDSGFMDMLEEFGVEQMVYGHLHGREAFKKGVMGVRNGVDYSLASADYLDFRPLRVI